jgi:hypothetical protein
MKQAALLNRRKTLGLGLASLALLVLALVAWWGRSNTVVNREQDVLRAYEAFYQVSLQALRSADPALLSGVAAGPALDLGQGMVKALGEKGRKVQVMVLVAVPRIVYLAENQARIRDDAVVEEDGVRYILHRVLGFRGDENGAWRLVWQTAPEEAGAIRLLGSGAGGISRGLPPAGVSLIQALWAAPGETVNTRSEWRRPPAAYQVALAGLVAAAGGTGASDGFNQGGNQGGYQGGDGGGQAGGIVAQGSGQAGGGAIGRTAQTKPMAAPNVVEAEIAVWLQAKRREAGLPPFSLDAEASREARAAADELAGSLAPGEDQRIIYQRLGAAGWRSQVFLVVPVAPWLAGGKDQERQSTALGVGLPFMKSQTVSEMAVGIAFVQDGAWFLCVVAWN